MYNYYKELESPNDFTTTYYDNSPKKVPIYPMNICNLPNKYVKDIISILKELPTIRLLIAKLKNVNMTYEQNELYTDFLECFEDNEPTIDYINSNNKILLSDLDAYFSIYKEYVRYLISFYPDKRIYLTNLYSKIKDLVKHMEAICWFEIPPRIEKTKWPNNWYITPNGYLYNACRGGNKTGGLNHVVDNIINIFNSKKNPYDSLQSAIDEIQGHITEINNRPGKYVTFDEFYCYLRFTKFPYAISDVELPVIYEMAYLYDQHKKEWKETFFTNIGISYHPKIRKIIIGHLNAQLSLCEFALKLYNECGSSEKCAEIIAEYGHRKCTSHLELVRFWGFHQIEPSKNFVINTTSTNLSDFALYIKNGWTINTITALEYDIYEAPKPKPKPLPNPKIQILKRVIKP